MIDNCVQVAGVLDEDEARMLVACGVDYIGLPLYVPVNREGLTESTSVGIVRAVGGPARVILITYATLASVVLEQCRRIGVRAVQLHGDIALDEVAGLRRLDPGLCIIKSVVIGDPGAPDPGAVVRDLAGHVDAFITDTFDSETGARGATGKTHDWRESREVVSISPRPVILAGGLKPENVREAIRKVGPAGVDVHSGVEDESGRKQRELVRSFVQRAREAFDRFG